MVAGTNYIVKYRATDGNSELLFLAAIFEPLPFLGEPAEVDAISTDSVTEDSPIPTSFLPTPPTTLFAFSGLTELLR